MFILPEDHRCRPLWNTVATDCVHDSSVNMNRIDTHIVMEGYTYTIIRTVYNYNSMSGLSIS